MIIIKTDHEVEIMREAGRIVGGVHDLMAKYVKPGITTAELDKIAEEFIRSKGAIPTFKGYGGFPSSICASVNEEVVHGMPSDRKLVEGDIISVDAGATLNGYVGDAARTFAVGKISSDTKKLIEVTRQSFFEGLKFAKEGYKLSDISHAVQQYAESYGFSVVRDFVGHGVGKEMHEAPQIPNFGRPHRGPKLQKGMVLAVEPMINMGTFHVKILSNDWTVVTTDGKPSAHYENTFAITDGEPMLLTVL